MRLALVGAWAKATLFYILARVKGFGKDTWVGAFAPRVLNAPTMEKYVSALYWAVTTFTTVGYGDIHPASRLEVRASVLFIVSRQWRGATSKK